MSSRGFSEEERKFVEETLSSHRNLEVKTDSESNKTKVVKVKPPKTPAYKNPYRWFIALASLPVLLVGGFFVLLMRAEHYLGGSETLDYLVKNNRGETGEMIAEVAENAGQSWLPNFLIVYEYRMPIVIAVVSVFLVILLSFVLIDNYRHSRKEESEQEVEEVEE